MVDSPEHILRFLPIKYATLTEQEYVDYWWETYRRNVVEENYHIAFLSFHLLYMTSVYYSLYKISKVCRPKYEHSLFHQANDDEKYYLTLSSPFAFSRMNEKSVFRFLKIAGADHTLIGEVSKFIEDRNEAAHAKGIIFYRNDLTRLEAKAVEYVKALEKIQSLSSAFVKEIGRSWKVSRLTNADLELFIEEELRTNSLNPEDIVAARKYWKKKNTKLARLLEKTIQRYYEKD